MVPRAQSAIRVSVPAAEAGGRSRADEAGEAQRLGLLGWTREREDGGALLHAEGEADDVARFAAWLGGDAEEVRPEGHEQFAIRGVPAGVFVVQEHTTKRGTHFDLGLEVDGAMRSWAVPKGPSMDPAVKRMAIQVPDHSLKHSDFEGELDGGEVSIWDRGPYEQGGRVPWPEALERGHAVFVLHGERLRGGFALQRTRRGARPQWLLIKRRDEYAAPSA